jgi:hypothetical protein
MSYAVAPSRPWEMRGRARLDRQNGINRALKHCAVFNTRAPLEDLVTGEALPTNGTPRLERGRYGVGANVPGTNNWYGIKFSDNFLHGGGSWTIQTWIYPVSWPGGFTALITQPTGNGFGIFFDTAGDFSYYYRGGSGGGASVATGMPAGKLSNLVVAYNGTRMEFFVNGASKGTFTVSFSGSFTDNYRLGDSSGGQSFNGFYHLVRMWSRELSAIEIRRLAFAPTYGLNFDDGEDDGINAIAAAPPPANNNNLLLLGVGD